jgi:serine/threonine protein phosphatase PrpC
MYEVPAAHSRITDEAIDQIGHVIAVPRLNKGDEGFNDRIEVFSPLIEGNDRAQIYQMWAVSEFASNDVALKALEAFGLAGDSPDREKWTQLLEHISGVTAIAVAVENLLEKYDATHVDQNQLHEAAFYDSLQKPLAVEAAGEMKYEHLRTATLVHDIEKPAELAATGGGGLENSLDNPVLRDGYLWRWMQDNGVDHNVIVAAQNTGRSDRFYSEYKEYDDDMIKKAIKQRESLAQQIGVSIEEVDAMSPTERRRASIEAKGPLAALVGFSDAMAAQFKLQGLSESAIERMKAYYLSRKKDSESVAFFSNDWPEYYKQVRQYLIDQVPEANRPAFTAELDSLSHERVFNETVLPQVLGDYTVRHANDMHEAGESSIMDRLRYRLGGVESWTKSKNADPTKNEDVMIATADTLVLADGATDKTGITYESGRSGGQELAMIAAGVAANSHLTGYELADEVTQAVRAFYETANPEAVTDPSKRAASTLIVAKALGDKLIVTQIGDSNIRITLKDGSQKIFTNDKLIDEENAQKRSTHIQHELRRFEHDNGREATTEEHDSIIASGRGVIQQRLNEQYKLQNNAEDSTYGYGTIDGMKIPRTFNDGTPTEFVRTYEFELSDVDTVELVSDGFYGTFTDEANEAAYAQLYERLHQEDPDKYIRYLSTKPNDDAAVLIAHIV